MTEAAEWRGRVGDTWAEEWRRTDRALGPVNDALVAEVAARLAGVPTPNILDIGCGAGATSLALRDRVPGATVTGIDISEPLVAAARERAADGPDLRFEVADAATWRPEGARYDAIVSRHGVMFFDDPVAAFANLRDNVAAGGWLTFSCFRARADNPWVAALDPIFARFAAAPPPAAQHVGPFAFAEPARVEAILTAAGFSPPAMTPLDFDFAAGVGDDPVADAIFYFSRIGPFASLIRELDASRRAAAIEQLRDVLAAHLRNGAVRFRAAAWIVTAKASP